MSVDSAAGSSGPGPGSIRCALCSLLFRQCRVIGGVDKLSRKKGWAACIHAVVFAVEKRPSFHFFPALFPSVAKQAKTMVPFVFAFCTRNWVVFFELIYFILYSLEKVCLVNMLQYNNGLNWTPSFLIEKVLNELSFYSLAAVCGTALSCAEKKVLQS